MKQGVVMISEKHRRMLISLSMVICLLAMDHAAKVSNPEAAVQGKRMLQQAITAWLQNAFPSDSYIKLKKWQFFLVNNSFK